MRSRVVQPITIFLLAFLPVLAFFILDWRGPEVTRSLNLPAHLQTEAVAFDQPAEANEYFLLKRSPDGRSAIQVQRYLDAIDRAKRMPQYSTANKSALPSQIQIQSANIEPQSLGAWTPLGPGNIGGRTRALLINPTNPDVMYAAGVAGGVWKSTNAGRAWTPLADVLSNIAFCSLAFDTMNPEVIYAGTGEGFFASDNVRGAGIFKTTDGGTTWSFLSSTSTDDFFFVNDIIVSPNDHLRVYAATRTGVWRSTNGGESWARSLNPLNGGATVSGGCLDLAIRTDQTNDYLFAACGTLTQATVYRNINAGDPVNGTPWTAVLTDPMLGRTSLAIAPSDQNVIYGLASSIEPGPYSLGLLAVFRSTASGDEGTWEARVRNTDSVKLNTVLLSNPLVALQTSCSPGGNFVNQGWYDNVIAVDPVDPNRVWAGGIDLFRSDDGGTSWGVASYWWAPTSDPHYSHATSTESCFIPSTTAPAIE